jgi:antitoxin YefM
VGRTCVAPQPLHFSRPFRRCGFKLLFSLELRLEFKAYSWIKPNIEIIAMDAITYTQARKNFTSVMNQVCEDHTPIIITRQSESPVVMMSLEDYNAIEETMYLLRSPKNAQRLYQALEQLKEGQYQQRNLIEEDEIAQA